MNKQLTLLGYSFNDGTLTLELMALGSHQNLVLLNQIWIAVKLLHRESRRVEHHFLAFGVALRLAPEPGQVVPDAGIVSFHRERLRFGREMFRRRKKLPICPPTIGRCQFHAAGPHGPPKPSAGLCASVANSEPDVPPPKSIDSNPNPAVFFF